MTLDAYTLAIAKQAASLAVEAVFANLSSSSRDGGTHLDSHIEVSSSHALCGNGNEVSDMASAYKQRVKIGLDNTSKPVYKWATGKTADDLNDSIVRIYVETGLIDGFLTTPMVKQETSIPTAQVIPTQKSTTSDDGMLFERYAENWMARYKKTALKPTTLNGYRSYLKQHLNPAFGNMNILEISVDDVQDFMNEHKEFAKKTLREWIVLLRQILDSAVEDHLIPINPAKSKRLKNPSDKVTQREALSLDDMLDIIIHISEMEDMDRRLMALLLFTGMRRGEVLGLRWEDIDFEQMLINVRRNVTFPSNQPNLTTTKTKNGVRQIPLDTALVALLERPEHAKGYILGGREPITLQTYRCMFDRIERSTDLHNATAHVFRHSYLTLLDAAGVNVKTLQMIAGHGDIRTTMNRYVHGRNQELLSAGDKFSALLSTNDAFRTLVASSEKYCSLLKVS